MKKTIFQGVIKGTAIAVGLIVLIIAILIIVPNFTAQYFTEYIHKVSHLKNFLVSKVELLKQLFTQY